MSFNCKNCNEVKLFPAQKAKKGYQMGVFMSQNFLFKKKPFDNKVLVTANNLKRENYILSRFTKNCNQF